MLYIVKKLKMFSLNVPKEVEINLGKKWIKITGPLGNVIKKKSQHIELIWDKNNHQLNLITNTKYKHFYLAMINKLIWGVYKGYKINLSIIGVGYKVAIENEKLIFKLGYSNDIIFNIPENIKIKILNKKILTLMIFGLDKQQVYQTAANIRNLKLPEPYKGKGIRYENEIIKQKEGKKSNV